MSHPRSEVGALRRSESVVGGGAGPGVGAGRLGGPVDWQNGTMALRWCAAGMIEAGKQFRRVNGHLNLPALRAFDADVAAETDGTVRHDEPVIAA